MAKAYKKLIINTHIFITRGTDTERYREVQIHTCKKYVNYMSSKYIYVADSVEEKFGLYVELNSYGIFMTFTSLSYLVELYLGTQLVKGSIVSIIICFVWICLFSSVLPVFSVLLCIFIHDARVCTH